MNDAKTRTPALWEALLPIAALILFLVVQISLLDLPVHLPLILGSIVAALMGLRLGHTWHAIEIGIVEDARVQVLSGLAEGDEVALR